MGFERKKAPLTAGSFKQYGLVHKLIGEKGRFRLFELIDEDNPEVEVGYTLMRVGKSGRTFIRSAYKRDTANKYLLEASVGSFGGA